MTERRERRSGRNVKNGSHGSLHPVNAGGTSSSQSIICIIQLSFTPTHSWLAGRRIMDLHGGLGDDSLWEMMMTTEIVSKAVTVLTV